jgi:Family of unknown function (DUF6527)
VTRRETIRHEFVETIPDQLQEGVLYISIPYATALHRCMCGCGAEIVTPLSPTDWELIFNGQTVSLSPSIGNWSYECQSHYWIRANRVRWSRRMSKRQIERIRELDRLEKEGVHVPTPTTDHEAPDDPFTDVSQRKGLFDRLGKRLFGRS